MASRPRAPLASDAGASAISGGGAPQASWNSTTETIAGVLGVPLNEAAVTPGKAMVVKLLRAARQLPAR